MLPTSNKTPTAQWLGCGFNVIYRILHRAVARGMEFCFDALPSPIGLDEKAIKKGPGYAMMRDTIWGIVLDVIEDRKTETPQDFIRRAIPKEGRYQVETMTTDKWWPFIRWAKELLPLAKLMHDRFHWIPYLNQAIDVVWPREVKK